MKELKIIFSIIITFLIAFATSLLLEVSLIKYNYIGNFLVVVLVLLELFLGYLYVKSEVTTLQK